MAARGTLASSWLSSMTDPVVSVAVLVSVTYLMLGDFPAHYWHLAAVSFLVSAQIANGDANAARYAWDMAAICRHVMTKWSTTIVILLLVGYAADAYDDYSKPVILAWLLTVPVVLVGIQVAASATLRKLRSNGLAKRAVIVGCTDVGLRLARQLEDDASLMTNLLGFFDDRNGERRIADATIAVQGGLQEVCDYVHQHRVEVIYIALPISSQPRMLSLLNPLRDTTVSIYFVPDIFAFELIQARLDDINGIPVVAVCESPFVGIDGVLKYLSDLVIAGTTLLLTAPLMLLLAIGVKLSSPGPILFRQRRYGENGEEIIVYKFRSMRVLEDGESIQQAERNDTRVTALGRIMRKFSLDELPQFINVLQGRMSIVGPRPHAVAHNEKYRRLVPGYMRRHKVKPGLTGWAQIHGLRGETKQLEFMQQRINYDLYYLRNWSLWLDLYIMLRTVVVVLKAENAY
jgi:putative colanic acid biosysnthesis UDP-glucose lipid carrier transferase